MNRETLHHLQKALFVAFVFTSCFFVSRQKVSAYTITVCDADIDQDSVVNIVDWTILINNFAQNPIIDVRADITRDNKVDIRDYTALFSFFAQHCTAKPTTTPEISGGPNMCNAACDVDTDCISSAQTFGASSEYICYKGGFTGAGACRLASNPTDASCTEPAISGVQQTPTPTHVTKPAETITPNTPTPTQPTKPKETVAPSISPTPTIATRPKETVAPTATPIFTTNICNKSCTVDKDCIASDVQTFSGSLSYVCYNSGFTGAGSCRLASNPSSVSCVATPTPTSAIPTVTPTSIVIKSPTPKSTFTPTPTIFVAPAIASFSLMNADTDLPANQLNTNSTTAISFSLAQYPKFNVRLNMTGNVGSVKIAVSGPIQPGVGIPYSLQKIENGWPYAVGPNTQISAGVADYQPWFVSAGDYTITVTPYSGINATGTAYTAKTLQLRITK